MQSNVSHSHGKVNVSAAAGGHFKYVPTNQGRAVEAAECLFSSECLCLLMVNLSKLLKAAENESQQPSKTVGIDTPFCKLYLFTKERESGLWQSIKVFNSF